MAHDSPALAAPPHRLAARPWRLRAAWRNTLAVLACLAVGLLVRQVALSLQLQSQHEAATHRLEFFAKSLEALIERNEALPALLALEPRLAALLDADTPAARESANHHLEAVASIAQVGVTYLMNDKGLTIAASNWRQERSFVGRNYAFRPYFEEATAGGIGRFYGVGVTTGEPGYFLASGLKTPAGARGVIAVKVSLDDFENAMKKSGEAVLLADRDGVVFLSALPEWKYRVLERLTPEAVERIRRTRQYGEQTLAALALSPSHSMSTRAVGGLGWRMALLTDEAPAHRTATVAGAAAALAAALGIGVVMHLDLRRRRHAERLAAEARLREVHATLEQRIAARTAELEDKVAALKRTEAILRETRDSAVQAGKLAVLGQLSVGMSHELNQPLAALHTLSDNAIELLAKHRLAEAGENLSLISQLAARMGRIVTQLKAFARKDAPTLGPVPVALAVEHALLIVEPRRHELRAVIEVDAMPSGLSVRADATRLEQVLVNLLRNGLDAVAAQDLRRQLQVRAWKEGTQVAIGVRDFGGGIAPDALAHLFEPFYTTKPVGQGLGLGLALSLAIVETFGGRLQARNAEGGGAEFVVWLEDDE